MFRIIGFTLLAISIVCTVVWATCHDSPDCADLINDLVSGHYWDEPNNNTIDYYVNTTYHSEMPPLTADVDIAAATWSEAEHNGQEIEFNLNNAGSTTSLAEVQDNRNVIAYGPLETDVAARVRRWVGSNNVISEQDMMFNYYLDFELHPNWQQGDVCIRNVATHEFGHFVRLLDLYQHHQCQEYRRYTMWGRGAAGHSRETLECEDIWGLWRTYRD